MTTTQLRLTEDERVARDAFTRLAEAADEFERYQHPHAARIAKLADELARRFSLGHEDRAALRLAALGHDLGEAAMRRDYIQRQGPLSQDERLDLARHPVIGEQEVARAGATRGAQLLVRWHQEWWNGAGYPDALRREQIPLGARILRVADAYAALTDARPYRAALSEKDARQHLIEWAGIEFDPQVVRAFLELRDLPELRSYALVGRAASSVPESGAQAPAAPRADEPKGIGTIPEAGTNPHVLNARPTDAPAQPEQQAERSTFDVL